MVSWAMAALAFAMAALLYWAVTTAPAGASGSRPVKLSQQVFRSLPDSFQAKLGLAGSGLLALVGLLFVLLGFVSLYEQVKARRGG